MYLNFYAMAGCALIGQNHRNHHVTCGESVSFLSSVLSVHIFFCNSVRFGDLKVTEVGSLLGFFLESFYSRLLVGRDKKYQMYTSFTYYNLAYFLRPSFSQRYFFILFFKVMFIIRRKTQPTDLMFLPYSDFRPFLVSGNTKGQRKNQKQGNIYKD